ncbi:MAG: transglycosylase domain-containing protein [Lachnospiraceae bacterium]|nr:transglycosylase domain-containing protein [Lachnospiraceae bacterium]
MNYSSKNIKRTLNEYLEDSPNVWHRLEASSLHAFLFLILAAIVLVCALAVGVVEGILDGTPDVSTVNIAPSGYATFIYDSDGNQLQKLVASSANRISVSLDKVPDYLQKAVIAVEDERFYDHNGIDPRGIIRAAFVGVSHGFHFSEGASTITQQLLKNNVFVDWTNENTMTERVKRKLQEQTLALALEKRLVKETGSKEAAKDLILENYLNTINLGAGTYGVQAAAQKYFHKDVWYLTLSEAAVIAGITQNPSANNPIRHPEKNAKRRLTILKKMVDQGYITEDQKNEALADDVYQRIADIQEEETLSSTVYSYFVDALTRQVTADLMEQLNLTELQASRMLYSGGLRIYTTQDKDIQAIMDEEYANEENFPDGTEYTLDWALTVQNSEGDLINYSREMLRSYYRQYMDPTFDLLFSSEEEALSFIADYKMNMVHEDKGDKIIAERYTVTPQPQSSMVILDQKTGHVLGLVGGRGTKTASLTLNRATDSTRQPGSTFKVIGPYSAALESGLYTMGSVFRDEPYAYSDGTEVHNSDNQYRGNITMRQAIINSVNVAAVKCISEITPFAAFNQLAKYGITTLDETHDVYQPLALGGIWKGVTNLELTAAYAAIANEGTYIKPVFYTRIYDSEGNIVLENEALKSNAVSRETSILLTSALQDVVKQGTGTRLQLASGMPVAGKTGTTSGANDVWFVGFTPYLTCGVWAGYDSQEKLPDEGLYRVYHQILWNKVMNRISETQKLREFQIPEDFVSVNICSSTNLIAGRGCPSYTEIYAPGTEPKTACNGEAHGRNYAEEIRREQEAAARAAAEAQAKAAAEAAEAARRAEEEKKKAEEEKKKAESSASGTTVSGSVSAESTASSAAQTETAGTAAQTETAGTAASQTETAGTASAGSPAA